MSWMRRYRVSIGAWAIFSIVLGALAPTITMAKEALDGSRSPLIEICTAQGLKTISLEQPAPDEPGLVKHGTGCAFCAAHTLAAVLPDTRLVSPPPSSLRFAVPLCADAVDRLFTWPAHHSRGPPTHA